MRISSIRARVAAAGALRLDQAQFGVARISAAPCEPTMSFPIFRTPDLRWPAATGKDVRYARITPPEFRQRAILSLVVTATNDG